MSLLKYKPRIVRYYPGRSSSENDFWENMNKDTSSVIYRKSFSQKIIIRLDSLFEVNVYNLFEKYELNKYANKNIILNTGVDFQIDKNYWCFYPHSYENDCLKQNNFNNVYSLDEYLIKRLLE